MLTKAVKDILRRIEALSDEDRLQLDRELAKKLETDWKKESGRVRRFARSRGITQDVIDRIIERHRYGS